MVGQGQGIGAGDIAGIRSAVTAAVAGKIFNIGDPAATLKRNGISFGAIR